MDLQAGERNCSLEDCTQQTKQSHHSSKVDTNFERSLEDTVAPVPLQGSSWEASHVQTTQLPFGQAMKYYESQSLHWE